MHGRIEPACGEIVSYIKREQESIIKRISLDHFENGAQLAHTVYETIQTIESEKGVYSIVKASPLTGRTHQLRVHFASLGFPICADDLYGYENKFQTINRQALHASSLEFIHPRTKEKLVLEAGLPSDINNLIKELYS